MIKYEVIDNYLSDSDFTELKDNILPMPVDPTKPGKMSNLAWQYKNIQVYEDYEEPHHLKKVTDIEKINPIHGWYFTHMFWVGLFQSYTLPYLGALLQKINPLSFYRIQANFTVQQEKTRGRSLFHTDYIGETSMITSIFYMNTTNGPTILEDGTEIECRANRLVSYPYGTYHAGVSCTDQPYRIVINFNYFGDGRICLN